MNHYAGIEIFEFSYIGMSVFESFLPSEAKGIQTTLVSEKKGMTPRPSQKFNSKHNDSKTKNDSHYSNSAISADVKRKLDYSQNNIEESKKEKKIISHETMEEKYSELKKNFEKDIKKSNFFKEQKFIAKTVSKKLKIKEIFQYIIYGKKDDESFFSSFGISFILTELEKLVCKKQPKILNNLIKSLEATYNQEMSKYEEEVLFFYLFLG